LLGEEGGVAVLSTLPIDTSIPHFKALVRRYLQDTPILYGLTEQLIDELAQLLLAEGTILISSIDFKVSVLLITKIGGVSVFL